jgi:hypothetical protein
MKGAKSMNKQISSPMAQCNPAAGGDVLGGYVSAEVAVRLYGLAVMTRGKIIEELLAGDLRNQSAKTEYTRQLIQASRGKAPS